MVCILYGDVLPVVQKISGNFCANPTKVVYCSKSTRETMIVSSGYRHNCHTEIVVECNGSIGGDGGWIFNNPSHFNVGSRRNKFWRKRVG